MVTPGTSYLAKTPSASWLRSGFFPSSSSLLPLLPQLFTKSSPFSSFHPLRSPSGLLLPRPKANQIIEWHWLQHYFQQNHQEKAQQSSFIGSERVLNLLLAACERAERETKAEIGEISEENLEVERNKMFIHIALSSDKFLLEDSLEVNN